jgi:hypothetical protein
LGERYGMDIESFYGRGRVWKYSEAVEKANFKVV